MISKKKVTALALAGLFVTPVLADTYVPDNSNSIQSGDGYLTADDTLFSKALNNSSSRTDSSKDAVKLSMWGTHSSNTHNDGLTELKLSGQAYDNVNYLLFADNSRQDNAFHRSSFSLDKTNLTLSRGILFRNASNSIETHQAGTYDANKVKKDLQNQSKLTLNDQSSLTGNVINQFNTQIEGLKDNGKYYYYQIGLVNNTEVSLTSSRWTGDLKDEINLNGTSLGEAVNKEDALSKNVISLKNGSIWTGGVDVAKKSTVDVTLDETSSWTVTKNSRVNSIGLAPSGARQAAKKSGVTIGNGVTLTIAEEHSAQSNIGRLHTGTGSSLVVEKADVTINSIGGSGTVQLNKNGFVTIEAASDEVNATLTSLDGSKLTTAEGVSASVTIAGALADEMGMDAVIKAYNDGKN